MAEKKPTQKKAPAKKVAKKSTPKPEKVEAEIVESTEIEVLESMGQHVRSVTKFEQTVLDMEAMVALSKKIKVTDVTDKDQIEAVKRSRIDLRAVEIAIEKRGKGYRDVFTAINKEISLKENELKKITSPEIERLEKLEVDAKAEAIRLERTEKLPERKERLAKIEDGVEIEDKELLEMDATAFEGYFNNRVAIKNETDRREAEEARAKEEARVQAEREAEQKKLDDAKAEVENQRLANEREAERLQAEKDAQAREKTARDEATAEAKRKDDERIAEEKRVADENIKTEAEKKAKLEKQNKYRAWRASHGWTEETKADFKEENTGETVVLWKKMGEFEIK